MAASDPITGNVCHTRVSMKKCNMLWTIDDFTVHLKREVSIDSSPFSYLGDDFRWVLSLTPPLYSNYCKKRNGHVSLQLKPDMADDDLEKFCPINGVLKCYILNADNVETKSQNKEFKIYYDSRDSYVYNYIHFDNFVEETFLQDQNNRLLSNDKLTIFCEVSYVRKNDIVSTGSQPFLSLKHLKLEEHMPVGMVNLRASFLNPEFSDITLHVKGDDYPAHKIILAAKSPVFKAMLVNNMQEKRTSRIEIKDMSKPAFTEMLRYIYVGQPRNLESLVSELLIAADKYDLEHLRNQCEKELYKTLSPKTAMNTLILAHMHHASTLKIQALQFIKMNSHNLQILDDDARKLLFETCPDLLLEILNVFGNFGK